MLYAEESFAHSCDLYDWSSEGLPNEIRVSGGVTLEKLQAVLLEAPNGLQSMGIPVVFERDQIQFGRMLSKQLVDCIVLKNTEHCLDYFHFTFTVRTTGNMSFISIYRSGSSPQNTKRNVQNERKNSSSIFQNILGAVSGVDNQSLTQEDDYYTMVADVIKALLL